MNDIAAKKTEPDKYLLDEVEESLPISWYYDPTHYEEELKKIWYRKWLYFCREETLAEPLAFKTMHIGSQRIWVARTEKGEVVGYYNTCPHRGSELLSESEGTLQSKRLNCPYHNWCFSMADGRLLATSSRGEPAGFNKEDYGLFPIAVHRERGFIFINLDASAQWKTDEIFDYGWDEQKNYPLDEWTVGHTWTRSIKCNWKTFFDNFAECLHCPVVHKGLIDLIPIFGLGIMDEKDHPDWQDHLDDPDPKYRGGLKEGAETLSTDGSAQGYIDYARYEEADIKRAVSYALALPGMYIAANLDHARVIRVIPSGPESMELQVEWLFQPAALEDPDYDTSKMTDFIKQVITEDAYVSELNQRGLHSAPMKVGVLMPEEYDVKVYRDWVLDALNSD